MLKVKREHPTSNIQHPITRGRFVPSVSTKKEISTGLMAGEIPLTSPWIMEVRSIEIIVKTLNDAKVKYLIVGGVAVVAHGYERFTKDLDLVISLERKNIIRGLRALMAIGYQMRIPVTPEQFADPALREQWRREKNMVVLQLWSDTHRRTPIDVFVYEPFDFAKELARARREPVFGKESAAIVSYKTLLDLKKSAGRSQDLLDVEKLRKLNPHRKKS
jgi:hypothetical protein